MRIRIIVEDEDKALEAEKFSYRFHTHLSNRLSKRAKGAVHCEADTECPEGMPNCRNCGDPEFIESCKAEGHCPDCGTKHGVAPDSIIIRSGYQIVNV